jgi:transcriptional regulator with XRE-family HTH domain
MRKMIVHRGNIKELTDKDRLSKKIGSRLKHLRKSMGLSIKQLAHETSLSQALFSRVENGFVIPSIPTLQNIADTLKIDITYFLEKEEEKQFVISKNDNRRTISSNPNVSKSRTYQFELLAEGMENAIMEPVIITLPTEETGLGSISHLGQEFTYILEGQMKLTLGEKEFTLKKGDAAYYNAVIPHQAISLSKKPARVLNVHFIPSNRSSTFEMSNPSEQGR